MGHTAWPVSAAYCLAFYAELTMYTRVQRFLKLKKSPASVARKSSVLILKNIFNFL
jgi:hypothetical protein